MQPMRLTLHAPAKINLFLRVKGRRPDGYHLLDTLMQKISLCDEVERIEREESALLNALLKARQEAGLSQAQVAERMGTHGNASPISGKARTRFGDR